VLLNKILNKTKFTEIYSVEHELKKVAILRVFLGIIVFVRYYEIFYSMSIFNPGMLFFQSILLLGITILFTFGVVTPISTILLAIGASYFDRLAGTSTLGTYILTQLLIVMFLMNHGMYGSVDSWIMQSKHKFSKVVKSLYSILGKPSKESIRIAYFLGFLSYALTSFGALTLHLIDPYWIQGLTLYSALTNSYLFKFYETTRYIEAVFPNLLFIASIIGIILQSIFQFLMIPLIFFKWGRCYIVIWGMIFFLISLIGINLSYLPHIEILFWLLIFFPINTGKQKIKIIYDDYCNLCTNGMRFLKAINFNGRYEFIALSKNKELYEKEGLTEKEVQTYMVGWVGNKKYIGYSLYIEILKVNPLLYILLPFFYIGKIGGMGSKIYNYIAENRYKVLGKCKLSSGDIISQKFDLDSLKKRKHPLSLLHFVLIAILLIFIALQYPIGINKYISANIKQTMNPVLYKFGLVLPGVFNNTDLSMGDHWLVIHRKSENSEFSLIPITDLDGSRLTYENIDILNFSNHNSDFFYFGNTLGYRRSMINVSKDNLKEFHTKGYGYQNIKKRILYDYNRKNLLGTVYYRIAVYKNTASHVKQWETDLNRYKKRKIYSAFFTFDGELLKEVEK